MSTKCILCKIMGALVLMGALNWGMIAVFQMDVVAHFLGTMTTATRVVYGLVGLAGVMKLVTCFKTCPGCTCTKT